MADILSALLKLVPLLGAGGQGFVAGRQAGQQYRAGEQEMELARTRAAQESALFDEQMDTAQFERTLRPMQERRLRQSSANLGPVLGKALAEELELGEEAAGEFSEANFEKFAPQLGQFNLKRKLAEDKARAAARSQFLRQQWELQKLDAGNARAYFSAIAGDLRSKRSLLGSTLMATMGDTEDPAVMDLQEQVANAESDLEFLMQTGLVGQSYARIHGMAIQEAGQQPQPQGITKQGESGVTWKSEYSAPRRPRRPK